VESEVGTGTRFKFTFPGRLSQQRPQVELPDTPLSWEPQADKRSQNITIPTPEAFAALPKEWMTELQQAAEALNPWLDKLGIFQNSNS